MCRLDTPASRPPQSRNVRGYVTESTQIQLRTMAHSLKNKGPGNARPPSRGHRNCRKSLCHKEIKNPAPNEGAGHSQGERRLLVIQSELIDAKSR